MDQLFQMRFTIQDPLGGAQQSTYNVKINLPPVGTVTVQPLTGSPLDTVFKINAENYKDDD